MSFIYKKDATNPRDEVIKNLQPLVWPLIKTTGDKMTITGLDFTSDKDVEIYMMDDVLNNAFSSERIDAGYEVSEDGKTLTIQDQFDDEYTIEELNGLYLKITDANGVTMTFQNSHKKILVDVLGKY